MMCASKHFQTHCLATGDRLPTHFPHTLHTHPIHLTINSKAFPMHSLLMLDNLSCVVSYNYNYYKNYYKNYYNDR